MTAPADDWIEEDYNPQSRFENLDDIEPEFWKKKKLEEMTPREWELLCDGCGKCCLNKIEIYEHRFKKVSDCRDINLAAVREKPRWLPKTCAYWLLDNGFDLPDWHPLKTGRAASVHEAGMSLQGRNVISETGVDDYENYLINWPDL